jgi:hypothetical protein
MFQTRAYPGITWLVVSRHSPNHDITYAHVEMAVHDRRTSFSFVVVLSYILNTIANATYFLDSFTIVVFFLVKWQVKSYVFSTTHVAHENIGPT